MISFNNRIVLSLCVIMSFVFIGLAQDQSAANLYNEGLALLKAKDYGQGLDLMEKAVAMAEADGNEKIVGLGKKNGAIAAYNLGNTKRKAGALDEAMTLYEKAAAMNPDYSSTYEGIGRTLEAQGKKQEAIASYLKAAELAEANGKTDRAAKRFKKVGTMIGKMYVAKKYDEAIAGAKAFVAVNDKNADVHYYYAKALGEKGDTEMAATQISKAVELAGAEAPDKYYYAQGSYLEKLGKKSEAITAYKKITEEKYKAQADYRISELGG